MDCRDRRQETPAQTGRTGGDTECRTRAGRNRHPPIDRGQCVPEARATTLPGSRRPASRLPGTPARKPRCVCPRPRSRASPDRFRHGVRAAKVARLPVVQKVAQRQQRGGLAGLPRRVQHEIPLVPYQAEHFLKVDPRQRRDLVVPIRPHRPGGVERARARHCHAMPRACHSALPALGRIEAAVPDIGLRDDSNPLTDRHRLPVVRPGSCPVAETSAQLTPNLAPAIPRRTTAGTAFAQHAVRPEARGCRNPLRATLLSTATRPPHSSLSPHARLA